MPDGIKPLAEYLREIEATERRLRRRLRAGLAKGAMTQADSDKIAAHARKILDYYQGVQPQGSFIDATGNVFDAIPIEQQASLRGEGEVAKPPGAPGWEDDAAVAEAPAIRQLSENWRDAAGNPLFAPPGTVPVRRVRPEDVLLPDLKRGLPPAAPDGEISRLSESPLRATAGSVYHYHAYCSLTVPSRGGFGIHSVHKNTLQPGQSFNLSQQWHSAGTGGWTGSGFDPNANLQTIEPIWALNPAVNGHSEPALQVYSTNHNYAEGSGGWGVGPDTGFIQTSNLWAFAGALSPLSVIGGQQRFLGLAVFLTDGKWWVYAGGKAPSNAVGYYPISWFNNGPLVTAGSQRTDFGGEVAGATQPDGIRRFGGMGSGLHANTAWRGSAYIRHMQYFDAQGFAQVLRPTSGLLTPAVTHSGYSAIHQVYTPEWNSTLWYGGPGGTAT